MSLHYMVAAFRAKVGNPLRKLVLLKLADQANDDGECWPSYQHIADQCEVSRTTVKNHIRELEKMGWLTREFRRDGELNRSNIYRLTIPEKGRAPAALVGQDVTGVGQELPEGGAGAARGGGAGAAPRNTHSLEPPKETPKETSERDLFSEFWAAYPRKTSKQAAVKAWAKLKPAPELAGQIMLALEQQKDWPQWTKDGGQFIPHPATWLNNKRWEDEPPAKQASRHHGFDQRDYTAGLTDRGDGTYDF